MSCVKLLKKFLKLLVHRERADYFHSTRVRRSRCDLPGSWLLLFQRLDAFLQEHINVPRGPELVPSRSGLRHYWCANGK